MKKSQLRKIIRESIKELINEQSGNPNSAYVNLRGCFTSYPASTHGWVPGSRWMTIDGNTPQIGDVITMGFAGAWAAAPYNLTSTPFRVTHTCPWGQICGSSSNPTQNHDINLPNWSGSFPYSSLPTCPPRPYRWHCKLKGDHPKFGSECKKIVDTYSGAANSILPSFTPPAYKSLQDCLESGCKGIGPGDDGETPDFNTGPTTPPTIPTVQSKKSDPAIPIWPSKTAEIDRIQELAKIEKTS